MWHFLVIYTKIYFYGCAAVYVRDISLSYSLTYTFMDVLQYVYLTFLGHIQADKIMPSKQALTCLATDACLTADPGVASSIPARSHTFVEIDHEIISTVILLPSADSFKKGCCQLQAKVCAQITG